MYLVLIGEQTALHKEIHLYLWVFNKLSVKLINYFQAVRGRKFHKSQKVEMLLKFTNSYRNSFLL